MKTSTLPIGIASPAFRRARVTTVLITQPGATLDERARNEHHCIAGLQPLDPASYYGALFLPRFDHKSQLFYVSDSWPSTGEQPDRGIAGRHSSRTMSRAHSSSRGVLYRAWGADQREAAPPLGFEMFWFCFLVLNSIGPIDSAMPGKRKRAALV